MDSEVEHDARVYEAVARELEMIAAAIDGLLTRIAGEPVSFALALAVGKNGMRVGNLSEKDTFTLLHAAAIAAEKKLNGNGQTVN